MYLWNVLGFMWYYRFVEFIFVLGRCIIELIFGRGIGVILWRGF